MGHIRTIYLLSMQILQCHKKLPDQVPDSVLVHSLRRLFEAVQQGLLYKVKDKAELLIMVEALQQLNYVWMLELL